MKKSAILLLAVITLGCDDTYVHEHIIDNFVCVYMPWWMADCQSSQVTDKTGFNLEAFQ